VLAYVTVGLVALGAVCCELGCGRTDRNATEVTTSSEKTTTDSSDRREAERGRLFSLRIDPVGIQRHNTIRFRLTVTNTTDSPLVWDRDFSIFLNWKATVNEDERVAPPISVSEIEEKDENSIRARLTPLAPRTSESTVVDFTGGFRALRYRPAGIVREGLPRPVAVFEAFEEMTKFRFDQSVKKITVWVEYSANVVAEAAFNRAFHLDPRDLGIPLVYSESNRVALTDTGTGVFVVTSSSEWKESTERAPP
jgi:hypothetical protein